MPSERGYTMKQTFAVILLFASLVFGTSVIRPSHAQQLPDSAGAFEKDLFEELNALRADPKRMIPKLEELKGRFRGNSIVFPDGSTVRSPEGPAVVDEAIAFLAQAAPVQKLTLAEGLARSARDHCIDQAASGKSGHRGSDGSTPQNRMRRYGTFTQSGENLAYGWYAGNSPEAILIQLVVDDGVKDRAHRKSFFRPVFTHIGIAHGSHPRLQTMTVINLAAGYRQK